MDIKEYQGILLSMMKILIDLCDRHGLRYYLLAGSMLGAVREHGFIPWDDDVDIGLPRKDYEKLIEIAPKELEDRYEMVYREEACVYHFVDKNYMVDHSKFNEAGFGGTGHPCLDIFPIDGAPSNVILRYIRMTKIIIYKYLHKFAGINEVVEHPERSRLEIIVIRTAKFLHVDRFFSREKTAKRWINETKKSDYEKSTWCLMAFGRCAYGDMNPKAWIGEGRIVPFRGGGNEINVRIFENYDAYLRQVYGDYMTPVRRLF